MVYYINFDGIFCSVFDSQIYNPIKLLKEKDINIALINFDRDRRKKKDIFDRKYEDIKTAMDNKVYLINKIKKGNFFEPLLLNMYIKKVETILTDEKEEESILLHCRGYYASYIALKLKEKLIKYNIKVIIDLRGKMNEEYKDIYGKRNAIYKMFLPIVLNKISKIEEYIVNNADYIFCVTNTFKEYINEKYRISEERIKVIPTCINYKNFKYSSSSRNEIRNKLKIMDKFIVTYLGAGQTWQQPEVLINTFMQIKKVIPSAFFLILTVDKEIFLKYISLYQLSSEDVMISNCGYNEVYKYLSAADLGLLIRKNNGVNRVASPTKFAEYMSCHVPIVLSRGIGDLDRFVQKYNIGVYYEETEGLGEKVLNVNRSINDFHEIVLTHYNWETKINEIIDVYNSLI